MQNEGIFYLEETQFFSLARYGDQLNRNFGKFLKILSGFFLGAISLVLLIPFAVLLFAFTSVVSRIAFNYLAKTIKKSIDFIDATDERTLMESLLVLEDLSRYMRKAKEGVENGGKWYRFYFTIFFGAGLGKCLILIDSAISKINEKVYPNRNSELSTDQLNELLVAYKGLERV